MLSESDLTGEQDLHLRECPNCARAWERQRVVAAGLRAVAAEWRHVEAPGRVEAQLAQAFRAHHGMSNPRKGRARPPRMWIPVASWFGAAAAVVFAAIMMLSGRPPVAHRKAAASVAPAMIQNPAEFETADGSTYNADDFIPLPNAQQIAPDEDVNLVRVELQRSAMIPLGYDVSADRASEPVEAEVVLGADGVARAVRFLDE
ncbi:MAG TPA: hypothetical protein VKU19_30800 [Bryobacteraceae bacterium]|nr:hypothetical protein [Bryobacteraceae bacterium]